MNDFARIAAAILLAAAVGTAVNYYCLRRPPQSIEIQVRRGDEPTENGLLPGRWYVADFDLVWSRNGKPSWDATGLDKFDIPKGTWLYVMERRGKVAVAREPKSELSFLIPDGTPARSAFRLIEE